VHGGMVLRPSLNLMTVLKLAVMTVSGALATPVIFRWFDYLNRVFNYASAAPLSFRADREIIRGRR